LLSSCLQARVAGWPRSKKIFFAVEHWSYVAGHIADRSSFDKFVAQEKEDELRYRERVAAEEAKGKEVAAEEAMEEKGVAAEDVKQESFKGHEHDVNAAKNKVAGEAKKPLPPPDSQSLESWETPPPAKRSRRLPAVPAPPQSWTGSRSFRSSGYRAPPQEGVVQIDESPVKKESKSVYANLDDDGNEVAEPAMVELGETQDPDALDQDTQDTQVPDTQVAVPDAQSIPTNTHEISEVTEKPDTQDASLLAVMARLGELGDTQETADSQEMADSQEVANSQEVADTQVVDDGYDATIAYPETMPVIDDGYGHYT
jgi:hypothetical protein